MAVNRESRRELENEIRRSGNSKVEDSGNSTAVNVTFVDNSSTVLLLLLVLDLYTLVQQDTESSPLREKILQHVDTILEREQQNKQMLADALQSFNKI